MGQHEVRAIIERRSGGAILRTCTSNPFLRRRTRAVPGRSGCSPSMKLMERAGRALHVRARNCIRCCSCASAASFSPGTRRERTFGSRRDVLGAPPWLRRFRERRRGCSLPGLQVWSASPVGGQSGRPASARSRRAPCEAKQGGTAHAFAPVGLQEAGGTPFAKQAKLAIKKYR
jgi:hypothetical protein